MASNKPILAFDCAAAGASIALHVGDTTTQRSLAQSRQAAELMPAIDGLMREAGLAYAELGTIVSTVGPGSFTGLRIGLAALHGLVLVHRTPIKLLTTLEAMAWSIARRTDAPFTAAIHAGKGELYAQMFHAKHSIPVARGDIFLTPETRTEWETPCYGNHLPPESPHYLSGPDSATLCAIAAQLPQSTLADALPLYIRPPDAVIPKNHAWLMS